MKGEGTEEEKQTQSVMRKSKRQGWIDVKKEVKIIKARKGGRQEIDMNINRCKDSSRDRFNVNV